MPALLPVTYTLGAWAGNWRDDDGTEWWVSSVTGWGDSPPLRTNRQPRPYADGEFRGHVWRAGRVIELTGDAVCPSAVVAERARDRLLGVLGDGALGTLVVGERDLTRQCDVELDGAIQVRPISDRAFEWRLRLAAPDPRRYATAVTSAVCGLLAPSGGLSFPLSFPLVFGAAPNNRLVLSNSGSAQSWPTWTITGPVTDPSVVNVDSGQRLRWSGSLAAGQTLLLDTAARRVLLDGVADRRGQLADAAWFPVPGGGSATVAFTAASAYDAAAYLRGDMREAWW